MRKKLFKDKKGTGIVTSVKRYMGLIQYHNESTTGGEDDNS